MCTIPEENSIGLVNATLSDDNTLVTIHFNNSVVLTYGFDIYSAIKITVTGPLEPYNVSWYLEDSD